MKELKIIKLKTKLTNRGNKAEYDSYRNEIIFSAKANLKDRIHEVGHYRLKHKGSSRDFLYKVVKEEIDAEIFAFHILNKEIDFRVALPALYDCADYIRRKKASKRIIFCVKSILNSYGIDLPKETEGYWINEYFV